ncbi:hypothetical protein LR48_Vigan02g169300 [Vigna angularis]|uniref:Protease inhibitor n=2 Tax=Phaseolus angularis TaxID=3914 RepID=A0A0L9TY84_PHAAN|nr:protease inhibitor [Vigna angularis]KOM35543.1 hypothetical protein LR48_Vigan02g169300 [Vigna angularis]BAT94761.1 hypothetical protein VIGAN_08139300 [Vigna angularis var. angularis]
MSECKGKSSWPELVGVEGSVAVATIERENPYVEAETVLKGSIVTTDFRCDRVRVWVTKEGIVYQTPIIG